MVIHELHYLSHGLDTFLDLENHNIVAKKRTLSLGVLGVDMNDGRTRRLGPGRF